MTRQHDASKHMKIIGYNADAGLDFRVSFRALLFQNHRFAVPDIPVSYTHLTLPTIEPV